MVVMDAETTVKIREELGELVGGNSDLSAGGFSGLHFR